MCMSVGIQALHEINIKCVCQDQALEFLHFFFSGHFYEDTVVLWNSPYAEAFVRAGVVSFVCK